MLEIVNAIASNLFDGIVGLGIDAGKNGIKKEFDQYKLKKALREFVEHNSQIRNADSFDEEIDYEGLVKYIRSNFLDEVPERINWISRSQGITIPQNDNVHPQQRTSPRHSTIFPAHAYCGKSGVKSKMGNSPDSTKFFIMTKRNQLLHGRWCQAPLRKFY